MVEKINVFAIPHNTFPTNRPMLISLWNKEFTSHGHAVTWMFTSSIKGENVRRIRWGPSELYLIRNKTSISLFGKFLAYASNIFLRVQMAEKILKLKKSNWIHVHDGLFEGLLGIYLSKKHKIKVSLAYTAPFIEMKKKLISESSGFIKYARKLWYFLFKYCYIYIFNNSEIIFPISQGLGDKLISKYSVNPKKIQPIPEAASKDFLATDKISDDSEVKKLIYVGYMRKERNLSFLIKAFKLVESKFENVKLEFLGWSEVKNDIKHLKDLASDLGVRDKVHFIGERPYSEVPRIISSSHIGLSPIPPIEIYLDSTPTKTVEYMSLGIPVVGNSEILDQKKIIEQSGGGICVSYDENLFAKAILDILSDNEKASMMGKKGKKWISENRTFERISNAMESKILNCFRN